MCKCKIESIDSGLMFEDLYKIDQEDMQDVLTHSSTTISRFLQGEISLEVLVNWIESDMRRLEKIKILQAVDLSWY
jgi:hypothetical protein